MSRTHRYRDRGPNGRLRPKYRHRDRGVRFPGGTPKWWRKLYMTRPGRRKAVALCRLAAKGVEADALSFPPGNRKPHWYYW